MAAETQDTVHFLDYWRVIRARQEIVIAVFLFVVMTGLLVTYSMDKVYNASAVVQVEEERPDIEVWREVSRRQDPLFLRTQYQIIQSTPVIEEVVKNLGLVEKLGKAYGYLDLPNVDPFDMTVKLVKKKMKAQQFRETRLMEIQVFMSEPKGEANKMAADIANEIVRVYQEKGRDKAFDERESALQAIQDTIEETRRQVSDLRAKVDEIREKYQITILSASAGTDTELRKRELMGLEADHRRAAMELEARKVAYEKIAELSPDELENAAPVLSRDPSVVTLIAEHRKSEVELTELQQSLGPKHPDVMTARSRIDELQKKLNDALKGLKTGYLTEYKMAQAAYDTVLKTLNDLKKQEIVSEGGPYRLYEEASEDLEKNKKVLEQLEIRYKEQQILERIPKTSVQLVEEAKPLDKASPVSPNMPLNIILSVLVGLVAGTGLAYFIEYMDTSVKTIDDVEQVLKVPVVGVIPQKVRPFTEAQAQGSHAEAYRVLRTNIQHSPKVKELKSLCVTSGSVGEGKSLTVFNLAYVCAQMGDKVLIVDSDLHRPRQHKILGVSNNVGLISVLMGEMKINEAIQRTKVPNLEFLPSGRPMAGVHGLLSTEQMRETVSLLRDAYDLVVFDAPPIIGVSDAAVLVAGMDGVLQVVQHRKYPRAVAVRAKDMIENAGANLLGVVLNNINISRDYSYYYHYYYYYPQSPKGAKPKTA